MQTTEQSKTLAKNYNAVKENIKKACEQAGRSQEEVTLLAVRFLIKSDRRVS